MPSLGGGPGAGARELAEDGGDGVRVLLAARVGLEDALLHALDLGADLALLVVEGDLEVLEGVDLDEAAFSGRFGRPRARARARRGTACVFRGRRRNTRDAGARRALFSSPGRC